MLSGMKRRPTDRVQIGLRLRESLRARLESAAKRSDISINEEIVDRLDRSFDRQDLLVDSMVLAYGKELAGLLMLMGRAMSNAGSAARLATSESRGDAPWTNIFFAYQQAAMAALHCLDAMAPEKDATPPSSKIIELMQLDQCGVRSAAMLTNAIKGKAPPDLRKWAATVRALLEPDEEEE